MPREHETGDASIGSNRINGFGKRGQEKPEKDKMGKGGERRFSQQAVFNHH